LKISIPKEVLPGENRVSITPDAVTKLIKSGFELFVQKDAGINSNFLNEQYKSSGATIVDTAEELYSNAEIILKIQRPVESEINLIKNGAVVIALFFYLNFPETIKACAEKGIDVIAMDAIPRITKAQGMDALSSQSNLAGYKSVLMTANELGKIFPLMMTAAGTITPAKVVIMGAGVAGLQALGTAKRLGAVVEVSDIRPAVKEEVQSLGGKFIEVKTDESMQDEKGYAKEASEEFLQKQKELIYKHVTEADIVITTALVPGKKAPMLVTEEMVKNMKPGSVILDMAVEFGGNCELSEKDKKIKKFGVTILGESNLPSLVPVNASEFYSKNLLSLLKYISKEGKIILNPEDDILCSALIVQSGKILHQ
jgi:H+-translocating NAD(P) transhydrogenase subunit alpha